MTLARIGRFRIERRLGSGSFATVWLARDEDLEAWVAIKVLADNWSFNEDARRRFLEEARALRHLDNDHIVRVYEVGRLDDDRPYMVMEHADRGTLEDRIRAARDLGRTYGIEEALDVSVRIAECLTSVHASRFVHRDVKPSNVLFRTVSPQAREALRRDGRPEVEERTLLGDFGIARRLEGMLGHTLVLGSPHYMAPEQADPGRAGAADGRSDVYSAAVILYELLTGRLPFRFESVADLQQAEGGRGPPPVERHRPDVPFEVRRVLHGGLATDPERRFGSAWEWRDALREARRVIPEPAALERTGVRSAVALVGGIARGSGSTGTTAPGSTGTTAPALTRVGTERGAASEVHAGRPPGSAPHRSRPVVPGRPEPPITRGPTVRVPGAVVLLASLAALAGVLLPWQPNALGTAFREGAVVAGGALVLFLAGLRMMRTRRRWVAIMASALALGLGGIGLLLVPVTMLVEQAGGSGLVVIFIAAGVAFAGGYRALGRLREDPRPWRMAAVS